MLEGDNIVSAARRAIMRHDYSAVLTIFPILRHLKMNKSEFDSTLQVFITLVSLFTQHDLLWERQNVLHGDGLLINLLS